MAVHPKCVHLWKSGRAFARGIGSDRSVNSIQHYELDDFPANDESGGGIADGNSFKQDRNFSITHQPVTGGEGQKGEGGDCGGVYGDRGMNAGTPHINELY